MKKTIRRIFSSLLALAMCMALSLTVFADSRATMAGAYGLFRGECYQNAENQYILTALTSVKTNDSGACLEMHIDLWAQGDSIDIITFTSEAGETTLVEDTPLFPRDDYYLSLVFVDHQIVDPSTGNLLYEVSTSEELNFNN